MISILVTWLILPVARAETTITCNYTIMSAPFASVELGLYDDGTPFPSAQISVGPGTKPHKESVTPEPLGPNELVHAWISKENPRNAVELIIYIEKQVQGQSKMINPNLPFGKEVWGECSGLP